MKTKIVILTIIVLTSLSGQEVGTGLTFLKLGVGARSIAMGEAATTVAGGSESFHYNPALMQFNGSTDVTLMHKEWIAGTTEEYLGAAIRGETISYGISAVTSSVGGIEVRTQPGPPLETFSAKNFAFSYALSMEVADGLSAGITGKFLYEKIFVDEADGYGFDVGAAYRLSPEVMAGVSLLNLGSMSKLKNESSVLPTTGRAGISYRNTLGEKIEGLIALDGVKTFDDATAHLLAGGELVYDSFLALRAGYQTGYDVKSISAGFGVRYGLVTFDYAFVPFTGAFTTAHTFSLSFAL